MKPIPAILFAALIACPNLVADDGEYSGPKRINKAIELLESGQPIYYTYGVKGSDDPRTLEEAYDLGHSLSKTWADVIMYNQEHAPLDFALLRSFMLGLVEGGPTPSGHRTPAVIVTLPVLGLDQETVRSGGWMIQQAMEFMRTVKIFGQDWRMRVHGNGLIAHMVRTGGS